MVAKMKINAAASTSVSFQGWPDSFPQGSYNSQVYEEEEGERGVEKREDKEEEEEGPEEEEEQGK